MTAPFQDPVLARGQLGTALRTIRERIRPKVTLAAAAERVGRPHSWLTKVEHGETRIWPAELEVLLGFLHATHGEAQDLMALASIAGSSRQSSMYKDFGSAIDPGFEMLLRIEAGASVIRAFEIQMIPALLQTERYITEVIEAQRDGEAPPRVRLRLQRQREILTRAAPPALTCVIGEGALRQEIGGAEGVAEQAGHIAQLVASSSVDARVLTYSAGPYAATNGAFSLFSLAPLPAFADGGPEVVAYQDTRLECRYYREPEQIEAYELMWADAVERALSPKESLRWLRALAKG